MIFMSKKELKELIDKRIEKKILRQVDVTKMASVYVEFKFRLKALLEECKYKMDDEVISKIYNIVDEINDDPSYHSIDIYNCSVSDLSYSRNQSSIIQIQFCMGLTENYLNDDYRYNYTIVFKKPEPIEEDKK